jgi:hypothetical protein
MDHSVSPLVHYTLRLLLIEISDTTNPHLALSALQSSATISHTSFFSRLLC